MKILVLLIVLAPFLGYSQMTDKQVKTMASSAAEPELIIESSSLILEKRLYNAEIIVDRLLEFQPNNANYLYRKGYVLLNSKLDYKQAMTYFEKALPLSDVEYDFFSITDTTCSNDIYYHLARCYHLDGQIKKAKEFYTVVFNFNDKTSELVKKASLNIAQCDVALRLIENQKKSKIKNIGNSINSIYPEYSPVISLDGQALYFTSRKPWQDGSTDKFKDQLLNNYPEDIYVSYKETANTTNWSIPTKLSFCEPERNEATIAVSPDERRIYVYQDNAGGGDIFYSDFKTNSFQQVKPLEQKDVNTKYWETHCAMTIDGFNMYFVSDRPGGFGGRDIYRVVKLPDGNWSDPKNLGPNINTAFDEDAPFIGADNKTLYYSSNGPESMGGFDLFLTIRDEDNNWSTPVNLGYPINGFGDDIYFTTTVDGSRGYYSSFRPEGLGEKDIYEIQNDGLGSQNIAGLRGVIKTAYNKPYPRNIIISIKCSDCDDKSIKTIYPRERDGSFFKTIEPCKTYETSYLIGNNKKAFFKDSFSTSCENNYDEVYREFILDVDNMRFISIQDTTGLSYEAFKLAESKKMTVRLSDDKIVKVTLGTDVAELITIKPIYFDFGKTTIRPDAALELDKVVEILKQNPLMNLELGSHTDCKGTANFNQNLSSIRAVASANYIKKRITNPKRIISKGYGESKLKNDCGCEGEEVSSCSDEEHQLNRRTEFIILKTK